jgi:hypothetical protein
VKIQGQNPAYLNIMFGQVAHVCNPTYSGARDQEDHGLKPA